MWQFLGLCLTVVSSCQADDSLRRFQRIEYHMGAEFKILLYAPSEEAAERAFTDAFERIAELDRILSDYKPESELSQLGKKSPSAEAIPVSDDLWQVIVTADRYSRMTEGAFDLTVGPLSRLWRRARRIQRYPNEEDLEKAVAATSYKHLELDEQTQSVHLRQAGMRLDAGGIAKGMAADEALEVLRQLGITRALVDASGDVRMGNSPPDRNGWEVGIAPLDASRTPTRVLHLSNCAVATSGDYWQHVVLDGTRYSHIIDPRTGAAVQGRSSVTVIAEHGIDADAIASSLSVMGQEQGLALAEKMPSVEALFLVEGDGAEVRVLTTRGFPEK